MTRFLIKRFVKNYQNPKDQRVREALGTLGSVTGLAVNLLLAAMKILLGIFTGSVAVTADGVNNLSDAGGSLVALISVRMAQKPYDAEHPFGHGRIEYIGALGVGVLIIVFGVELLKSAVESIVTPAALSFSYLSLGLLAAGILAKLWLWRYYRYIGRESDNPTLLAASQDSLSDVFATGAVLLSALLSVTLGWTVDGYVGLLVALLVFKAGYEVLRDMISRLLGGKPDKELGTKIIDMLLSYDGILGVHDFVLHDYGPGRSMASVHAEVAASSDFVQIHEVVDRAEREVGHKLGLPICIHMDPVMTGDKDTEEARARVQDYLSSLTPPLKLHDFRRVPGKNQVNLIFDVLLPPGFEQTDALRDGICAHARTLDHRYRCVIHFDRDYFTYGK